MNPKNMINLYDIDNKPIEDLTIEELKSKIKYFKISLNLKGIDENLRKYREENLPKLEQKLKDLEVISGK